MQSAKSMVYYHTTAQLATKNNNSFRHMNIAQFDARVAVTLLCDYMIQGGGLPNISLRELKFVF